jgi:predicted MFS family arabinose efflux permease
MLPRINPWRATLSGLSASLVGIGLARFAYAPLLPAIIAAHWFPASTAAYLGAANLAGYLAGALLAGPLAARLPVTPLLRFMMLLTTAAFFACGWNLGFLWFFAWRFASGVTGGVLMVLTASTILPHIAPAKRGITTGFIFLGVGLGIEASGTLVPLLLRQGLSQTWFGLGVLALILTVAAWGGWPRGEGPVVPQHQTTHRQYPAAGLRALYAEYGLNAVGIVPHMLFLADYVARGLGQGMAAGAEYWVLFGLGAIAGPILTGHLADRIGFNAVWRVGYGIEAVAVALPILGFGPVGLMVSSMLVGAFTPGMIVLALGRVHLLLVHHPASHKAAWSKATTSFAVMQALSAYGMSYVFACTGGNYLLLFALGSGALVLALGLNLTMAAAGMKRGLSQA